MGSWERLGRTVGLLVLVATLSAASAGGGLLLTPLEPGGLPESPVAGLAGQGDAVTTQPAPQDPQDHQPDARPPNPTDGTVSSHLPQGGGSAGESSAVADPRVEAVPGAAAPTPATLEPTARVVTHIVARGETLSGIAAAYGVSVATVAWASGLSDPNRILPGQKLEFPTVDGVIHRVARGDTLFDIARLYQVDVMSIVRANGVSDPDTLYPGQVLVVPGATPRAAATVSGGPSVTTAAASSSGFIWPLRGAVTSYFGPRWGGFHTGIDIAGSYGATIRAARSGRVTFAGYYGNYGRTVIIDHGGGLSTLYSHASKLLVTAGQDVAQGQAIAQVGSSGNSTGPHLHFEVRVNGQPKNPMNYLKN